MKSAAKFVLFPLGDKRFALPAAAVSELAQPDTLQSFPHTTPLIAGVLLRRNKIMPVMDIAQVLKPDAPARKFYLIAARTFDKVSEATAVPVSGECELVSGELLSPTRRMPHYVTGLLSRKDEIIEVVDLERLAGGGA